MRIEELLLIHVPEAVVHIVVLIEVNLSSIVVSNSSSVLTQTSSSVVVIIALDSSSLLRTSVDDSLSVVVDNDDSVQYSVQYMVYFGGAFYLFSQIINPASFQELYMIENSYGWQQKNTSQRRRHPTME